ncbi:MAG: ComEC/Rec2 family competence protein, partial [Acidiferrobacterales bacterium]
IISDGDNDHIGGAQSVIEGLPVNDILTSVPAELKGARRCIQGQQWKWDAVDFWILHPPNESRWEGNNASCLLAVSSDYGSILLPGDIEEAAEAVLVQSESLSSPTTILVAPHHGSRTSSTEGFVEAVQPQLVLFAVGYRNQFGHPNPRVRERYLQYGAQTYDSPTHGAIEVELGVTGTQVSPYREQTKRYWFSQ